jgi:F-type H+-transporting ATPase subunit b
VSALFAAALFSGEGVEAPNPILPATDEIIWGAVSFAILMLIMWKFAVPAIKKTMAARSARIEGDLASAEKAKSDADTMIAEYKAKLADAQSESNRIIDDARQQAEAVRKDLIARAEADAAAIRAKASEDLNLQADRLKADLSSHVKNLSLDLAEKVVGANMNKDTNAQLVDRYIAELASKN